jgi:hypothetical protein
MAGGIQAGSRDLGWSAGQVARNWLNLPLERKSASCEPVLEHLVIFSTDTLLPSAAETLAIAPTSVLHSIQVVLYPFLKILTDPALST